MASLQTFLRKALEKSGYILNQAKRHPLGQRFTVKHNSHDERTTAQLQNQHFSGIRANDLWNRFEIWIYGRIDDTLPYQTFWMRPESLNELYAKCFGLDHFKFDTATEKEIARIHSEKEKLGRLKDSDLDRLASEMEKKTSKEKGS